MKKFLAGLGAVAMGFGFYNIFTSSQTKLMRDFLIPVVNVRYSELTTSTASYIFIGVGFALIVVGLLIPKE